MIKIRLTTIDFNYELYEQCGIVIKGLDKIIPL
jgi:hypothetical protein